MKSDRYYGDVNDAAGWDANVEANGKRKCQRRMQKENKPLKETMKR
jgi:hypothetical protein